MEDLKLYDPEAPLKHVQDLEFKRLAGSKGEEKAINYISRELKKADIEFNIEPFDWCHSTTILMKLAFIFLLVYVNIYQIILFNIRLAWLFLILDGLLIVMVYFGIKMLLDMTKIIFLGKKRQSKNLIAHIPANDERLENKPLIIFSAHYDSISNKYSHKTQILLYISAGILSLIYLLLTLILAVISALMIYNLISTNEAINIARTIAWIIGGVLTVIIVLILLNRKTNESNGSIDNATGVSILIELVKLLKKKPLKNMNLIFIWCGAEEWGLWGSKQYCKEHFTELKKKYDLDTSYNINIDMVGTYVGIVDKTGLIKRKCLNDSLNDVFHAIAKQKNMEIKRAYIPIGAGSDHMSFKAYAKKHDVGMEVSCFISMKDGKFIHSPKDMAENCSEKVLNECIDLIHDSVRSIDLRVLES